VVDLAGFPKDRYYLYQSEWTTKPMVHLLPHWNWPGREGAPIPVMAYSNAEEVELLLNGKSLGRKARYSDQWDMPVAERVLPSRIFRTKYRRIWQVPYAPGILRAVAYNHGTQVAVEEVKTAGAPAKLRLIPDRATIRGDGDDLSFITVRVEDQDGNLCPEANPLVHFKVSDGGEIAGVDNGNAASTESFKADHHSAFNGLALLILRSKPETNGLIEVTADAEALASGRATITIH
jgi:beta-galactosidase